MESIPEPNRASKAEGAKTSGSAGEVAALATSAGTQGHSPRTAQRLFLLAIALNAASLVDSRVALPAGFILFLSWLTRNPGSKPNNYWLMAGAFLSLLTFLVFLMKEALPGIVDGGRRAINKSGVSLMREVITAQDKARISHYLDHDKDGIGSALTLRELSGLDPISGSNRPLSPSPLLFRASDFYEEREGALYPSRETGSILISGSHFYKMCFPDGAGNYTEIRSTEAKLLELSERDFVLLAWPFAEQEQDLMLYRSNALEAIEENASGQYLGRTRIPSCALASQKDGFIPWRTKKARKSLPGDSQKLETH